MICMVDNPDVLLLGKRGEHCARTLHFDMTEWLREWPDALFRIAVLRPGENTPYHAVTSTVGNVLQWTVSRTDTAIAGKGSAEIHAIVTGENDATVMAKSAKMETHVLGSLAEADGMQPPDAWESWLERLENAAANVDAMARLTISAEGLESGDDPTAELQTVDGHRHILIGIPISRGPQGEPGLTTSVNGKEQVAGAITLYGTDIKVQASSESTINEAINDLALEITGRASTAVYTATLAASGWSGTVPRKQTVIVEGILATDTPFVDINMSGATTGAAGTALTDAWTLVGRVEAGAGTITAYCYDDAPTVNIPVILKVVR